MTRAMGSDAASFLSETLASGSRTKNATGEVMVLSSSEEELFATAGDPLPGLEFSSAVVGEGMLSAVGEVPWRLAAGTALVLVMVSLPDCRCSLSRLTSGGAQWEDNWGLLQRFACCSG